MRNLINLVSLMEAYSSSLTLSTYNDQLWDAIKRESRSMTPSDALQSFEDADPTPKKAFVLYLVKWYLDGSMRFVEDASKATEPFELYSKFRNRADMPKLASLSFSELLDLGDKLSDTKSKKEENKEIELAFYKNGTAELYVNNDEWKVVIPKTKEAAIYFGRNTRWCTSAEKNNMFEYYSDLGELYIILEKKTNKRWQFHFETDQFMDEEDYRISSKSIKQLLRNIKLEPSLDKIKKDGRLIRYVSKPTEEIKLAAVESRGSAIGYITNPSEKIQLAAINQDAMAILNIINPSEKVQIAAVKKNENAIWYIDEPTEALQLFLVRKNPLKYQYLKGITDPSEAVKLEAVSRNGYVIGHIKNPSEQVQLAAVRKDKDAIRYITNPTEAVIREANKK